jgi:hypothetical protein
MITRILSDEVMSGSSFNITIITSSFAIRECPKEFTESLGILVVEIRPEDEWTR